MSWEGCSYEHDLLFANFFHDGNHFFNVTQAIALATSNEKAINRIYNVGEDVGNSELKWIEKIGKAMDGKGKFTVSLKANSQKNGFMTRV